MFKKLFNLFLSFCFLSNTLISSVFAGTPIFNPMPVGAQRAVPMLRYLSINSANPYNYFNFLMDKGNSPQSTVHSPQKNKRNTMDLNQEAKRLIQYFFLGLTLKDDSFWVNLKPNEPDKITSEELSNTDLGKVLLEQDLQLKKDVAKYLHPDNTFGRMFWEKLYAQTKADKSTREKITTSQRVWIVPDQAVIIETNDGAFVEEAKLKVLLENEYLNTQNSLNKINEHNEINALSESLMRQIIIPRLESDINNSAAYAPLRQAHYSLVLAAYYRQKFNHTSNTKDAYAKLINQNAAQGLESQLPWSKDKIWQDYLKSYSKGEYNIKASLLNTTRMYFSGGVDESRNFLSSSIDFSKTNKIISIDSLTTIEKNNFYGHAAKFIFQLIETKINPAEDSLLNPLLIIENKDNNTTIQSSSLTLKKAVAIMLIPIFLAIACGKKKHNDNTPPVTPPPISIDSTIIAKGIDGKDVTEEGVVRVWKNIQRNFSKIEYMLITFPKEMAGRFFYFQLVTGETADSTKGTNPRAFQIPDDGKIIVPIPDCLLTPEQLENVTQIFIYSGKVIPEQTEKAEAIPEEFKITTSESKYPTLKDIPKIEDRQKMAINYIINQVKDTNGLPDESIIAQAEAINAILSMENPDIDSAKMVVTNLLEKVKRTDIAWGKDDYNAFGRAIKALANFSLYSTEYSLESLQAAEGSTDFLINHLTKTTDNQGKTYAFLKDGKTIDNIFFIYALIDLSLAEGQNEEKQILYINTAKEFLAGFLAAYSDNHFPEEYDYKGQPIKGNQNPKLQCISIMLLNYINNFSDYLEIEKINISDFKHSLDLGQYITTLNDFNGKSIIGIKTDDVNSKDLSILNSELYLDAVNIVGTNQFAFDIFVSLNYAGQDIPSGGLYDKLSDKGIVGKLDLESTAFYIHYQTRAFYRATYKYKSAVPGKPTIKGKVETETENGSSSIEKPKILIVDNNEGYLNLLKEILGEKGYHVITARGIENAKDILSKNKIQLCISSVSISPGTKEDGLELAEFISKNYPKRTKLIIMSAFGPNLYGYGEKAKKNGALYFFTKDNSINTTLLPKIKEYVPVSNSTEYAGINLNQIKLKLQQFSSLTNEQKQASSAVIKSFQCVNDLYALNLDDLAHLHYMEAAYLFKDKIVSTSSLTTEARQNLIKAGEILQQRGYLSNTGTEFLNFLRAK